MWKILIKKIKDIFIEICEMIYALHGLNPPVIHRDIKPSNMIVDDRGKLKLIDFGTAVILNGYECKASDECEDVLLAGTKGYAAPEQYGGLTEGIKTDIYQIGKTMRRIIDRADVSRGFFEGVMEIADRCCSSSFYERYSGVSDIRIDLIKIKTSSLKKALFGRMFLHGKRCIKESDKSKDNRLFIDIVRTCDSIEFL